MTPLVTALVLLTSQAEVSEDGRGGAGTSPVWRPLARRLPRVRFGLGTAVVLSAQPTEYYAGLAGGPGVSLEFGVVLADRVSVLWRGEAATTVTTIYGSNAVVVDYAFSDQFALGLGAAFTLWNQFVYLFTDSGYVRSFVGLTFPVRAHVMLGRRKEGEAQRTGWTLSAHFAPGFALNQTYLYEYGFAGYQPRSPPFAMTVGLGVGYLWW